MNTDTSKGVEPAIPSRYVSITLNVGREHLKEQIDKKINSLVEYVHINGFPLLWVIKRIIALAPKLKVIRFTQKMSDKLGESHIKLLTDNGIRLETGYARPSMVWKDGEIRDKNYHVNRQFFLNLTTEQKKLLDELDRLGSDVVSIARRYFCLDGENYVSQEDLGEMLGYSKRCGNRLVSCKINALLQYLDKNREASIVSAQYVERISNKVTKTRARDQKKAEFECTLKALGISSLPKDLPLVRLEFYGTLYTFYKNGKVAPLATSFPSGYEVLMSRYGLEDGRYKTLQEVGTSRGLTRERIRQIEETALRKIGIIPNED